MTKGKTRTRDWHSFNAFLNAVVRASKRDWREQMSQFDFTESKVREASVRHCHRELEHVVATRRLSNAATALHETEDNLDSVATSAGFDGVHQLDMAMLATYGLDAQGWRSARGARTLTLTLPPDFRREETLSYIGRDRKSPIQRRTGETTFSVAIPVGKTNTARVDAEVGTTQVTAQLTLRGKCSDGAGPSAVRAISSLLGFGDDTTAFEDRARTDPTIAGLIARRPGLRVSRTIAPFDAVVWSIIGQQISLPFAYQLLRELTELVGSETPGGMVAMPRAEQVASLEEAPLTARKFSRAKVSYLLGAARMCADGDLDLRALQSGSAVDVYEKLLAVRGLGPWSVNYIMMRALGFADCAPIGDAGLRRALQRFFVVTSPITDAQMSAYMERFAPNRSLATFHLWRSFDKALETQDKALE